jgi:hypothetical protein
MQLHSEIGNPVQHLGPIQTQLQDEHCRSDDGKGDIVRHNRKTAPSQLQAGNVIDWRLGEPRVHRTSSADPRVRGGFVHHATLSMKGLMERLGCQSPCQPPPARLLAWNMIPLSGCKVAQLTGTADVIENSQQKSHSELPALIKRAKNRDQKVENTW